MPTPCGCAHAPDSRHTHSPDRMTVHVHGQLRVDRGRVRQPHRIGDTAAEVGGRRDPRDRRDRLARDDRAPQTEPRDPGPGFGPAPHDEPHVVHVPEADRAFAERELLISRPRRAAAARRPADAPSRSCRRRRSGCVTRSRARPRGRLRRAASPRSTAPCGRAGSCARAARAARAAPGRISSTVSRATNAAGPGSCVSHTVANNALGAPPCNAFGLHGPRASWVGHVARAVAFEQRADAAIGIVGHGAAVRGCGHPGKLAIAEMPVVVVGRPSPPPPRFQTCHHLRPRRRPDARPRSRNAAGSAASTIISASSSRSWMSSGFSFGLGLDLGPRQATRDERAVDQRLLVRAQFSGHRHGASGARSSTQNRATSPPGYVRLSKCRQSSRIGQCRQLAQVPGGGRRRR